MKKVENFEEFMSYVDWDDMEIEEKRGLYDVVSEELFDLGRFRLTYDNTEKGYVLYDTTTDVEMHLTPDQKQYFPRWLEKHYMKGVDGEAYFALEE